MILTSNDPASECHKVLAHLLSQFLEVDREMAILLVKALSNLPPLCSVSQMPSNWTKLGRYIYLKGGAYSFRARNDQTGSRKHPEPWLVFMLASETETAYLLQSVLVGFECINGHTIRIKSCQSVTSLTPVMFPFLFNKAHLPLLHHQIRGILQEAHSSMVDQRLIDYNVASCAIPDFNLRVNNPRLPYQANQQDKEFNSFTNQNKQIIHL